jgi:hypothetical protein
MGCYPCSLLDVLMEKSDASINVSEETAVFRIRIENVTLCSLPNYSTRIPEDSDLCKRKMGEVACVATSTALLWHPQ